MSGICPCTMGNSISGALFNLRNAKKLNEELPEQTASAVVLSRRVDTVYSLTRSSSSWAYLVTFRLENGEQLELKTTEEHYPDFKEGACGTLTWQAENILSFDTQ
ncbi:MAG: DUF2500 family protein [Oscillospiraceae bacterium]|nr:DUF2500 family protein [Oscillospiraceae bacterium]